MRYMAFALAFILSAWAGSSQALPQIVIYNYTPPVPDLMLTSVVPADHQELSAGPQAVAVYFSVAIDLNQSSLAVFDPYNNLIANNMTAAPSNGMTLALPPKKLLSGTYRIDWKATCACKTRTLITGSTYFTID